MSGHIPHLTEGDIKRMAREAERENASLPVADRRPKGWHFRRAAIQLGIVPLKDLTLDELVWYLDAIVIGRVGGV